MRRLTQAGQTIHSVHDAAGKRIAEYLYDESALTSSLIREYIWADGKIVAVVENGTLYSVRTDHIGRPVFATDNSGTKVWEASYLPFGGVDFSTGPNIDLRFPGQWFQTETALHQNWMRDYDPTLGRYLQADPLGLVDGASVYGYALQSPGRYVDPRGEQTRPIPILPPVFQPGTPEEIASGQAIVDGIGSLGEFINRFGANPLMSTVSLLIEMCKTCPPCTPYPAGTIGYRSDNHPHNTPGVGQNHLNLYRVNQNPNTCKCFWNANDPYHVNPPPDPNWIALPSTGRYGSRNVFPSLSP